MEIDDVFQIQFKTGQRTVKDLICPRCIQDPVSEQTSTTDNNTLICNNCAQSERAYAAAKAKGASNFTLNLWGYEQDKWPIH